MQPRLLSTQADFPVQITSPCPHRCDPGKNSPRVAPGGPAIARLHEVLTDAGSHANSRVESLPSDTSTFTAARVKGLRWLWLAVVGSTAGDYLALVHGTTVVSFFHLHFGVRTVSTLHRQSGTSSLLLLLLLLPSPTVRLMGPRISELWDSWNVLDCLHCMEPTFASVYF